jgi:hypothetical protein
MSLDRKEAAASLDDIAAIERRTRETLFYGGSSDLLILWGVLTLIGHTLNWFAPQIAGATWLVIDIGGCIATIAIVARRMSPSQRRAVGLRWAGSYIAFLVFGFIVMLELWPLTARQQQVFWPTLVMFGYVLAGMWVGRFFLYIGVAATALLLLGYYFAGDLFPLWLALVFGGGLIAGGAWLRRAAA